MRDGQALAPGGVVAAVGVDLVNVPRLKRVVLRWGDDLLEHLFTQAERSASCGEGGVRWESMAGKFAAKEATKKVLASRGHAVGWTEVEVVKGSYGEPLVRLHGRAQAAAERCGLQSLVLSIAHDGDFAVAIVIATSMESQQAKEAS